MIGTASFHVSKKRKKLKAMAKTPKDPSCAEAPRAKAKAKTKTPKDPSGAEAPRTKAKAKTKTPKDPKKRSVSPPPAAQPVPDKKKFAIELLKAEDCFPKFDRLLLSIGMPREALPMRGPGEPNEKKNFLNYTTTSKETAARVQVQLKNQVFRAVGFASAELARAAEARSPEVRWQQEGSVQAAWVLVKEITGWDAKAD